MLPQRIELLQAMPVFGALRADALELLLARAASRQVRAGEAFFHEQEPASSMFVLERGRAAVVKHWAGRELVLHRLGAGDCFGEMALMDLLPRSATVLAELDCLALEFNNDDLLHLFERDPEQFALIQMNLGREVCRRLRAADAALFRVMVGDATGLVDPAAGPVRAA